jgi:23S rRNA (pseudouridine1915-N3)-methyltransferase
MLGSLRDVGTKDLAFIIGGPDGLSTLPGKKAGRSLAFGPQTWPHLLARALLTEQVYRALTILAGHPYHRA